MRSLGYCAAQHLRRGGASKHCAAGRLPPFACALLRGPGTASWHLAPKGRVLAASWHPLAGMRVIGVTTSLAPEAMQAAAPDWIQPSIKHITVEDIRGLRLAQHAQQAQQVQHRA